MNIGEKIKVRRKEKGYSVKDVVTEASLGGTSRKADIARLERIEDGRDHPTFKQLRELRSALGLDLNEIIKGDLTDEIEDWEVFNNNCRKLYLESDYTLKEIGEKTEMGKNASSIFSNRTAYKSVEDYQLRNIMELFNVDLHFLNKERGINYFNKVVNKGAGERAVTHRKSNIDESKVISKSDLKNKYSLTETGLAKAIRKARKYHDKMILSDGKETYLNKEFKERFEKIMDLNEIKEKKQRENENIKTINQKLNMIFNNSNDIYDHSRKTKNKLENYYEEIKDELLLLKTKIKQQDEKINNLRNKENKGFFAKLFKR